MKKLNTRGFTIIELMIAATVFSIILLGASSAIIQIGRMYYKGVISSRTQNVTRTIMDDLSRAVQFSGDDITIIDDPLVAPAGVSPVLIPKGVFCIGSDRYTFLENTQLSLTTADTSNWNNDHKSPHVLWKDEAANPSNCRRQGSPSLGVPNPGNGEELMGEDMRIVNLDISGQDDLWTIDLTVAYGDDDVFENGDATTERCRGIVTGSQWCAVSKLTTSVYKRVQGE